MRHFIQRFTTDCTTVNPKSFTIIYNHIQGHSISSKYTLHNCHRWLKLAPIYPLETGTRAAENHLISVLLSLETRLTQKLVINVFFRFGSRHQLLYLLTKETFKADKTEFQSFQYSMITILLTIQSKMIKK